MVDIPGPHAAKIQFLGTRRHCTWPPALPSIQRAKYGSVGSTGPGYICANSMDSSQAGCGSAAFDLPLGMGRHGCAEKGSQHNSTQSYDPKFGLQAITPENSMPL